MTRRETALGWCYLLFSMFALPFILVFFPSLSVTEVNLIYFFLNFLSVILVFHRFLWVSVKKAARTPWQCLRFAVYGFGLYYLLSLLLSRCILLIDPDFFNVNDASLLDMTREHTTLMILATVFLVPVYEEVMYRGLFFLGLHKKSRLLAYGVSMLVFSSIHVMGYIGIYDPLTLTLCFTQYLPAGFALAWAYEKADTIAAPILIHITINQIGISALR